MPFGSYHVRRNLQSKNNGASVNAVASIEQKKDKVLATISSYLLNHHCCICY